MLYRPIKRGGNEEAQKLLNQNREDNTSFNLDQPLTEQTLLLALRNRSEEAFRQLVEDYKDKVYNTCLSLLKNEEEAEESAQDVFMEVYRSVESFRAEAKLSTWIYRIATTKSLEKLRRMKAKKRFAWMRSLSGGVAQGFQSADWMHPGVAMEQQENAKALLAAIDKLSDNQRLAFTLHKLEGLSYEEVAHVLQVSVSSVESLMFRARQNLKKQLRNFYEKNMID
ncbi:MAG: RNA polymerase sigma factor [Bacteroidota bacterium]|nr:RNA polymerase sigma factor [Bacteroidota bacterium]